MGCIHVFTTIFPAYWENSTFFWDRIGLFQLNYTGLKLSPVSVQMTIIPLKMFFYYCNLSIPVLLEGYCDCIYYTRLQSFWGQGQCNIISIPINQHNYHKHRHTHIHTHTHAHTHSHTPSPPVPNRIHTLGIKTSLLNEFINE